MAFQGTDPTKLYRTNTLKSILATPAGNEMIVLMTGSSLAMNVAVGPYFLNQSSAVLRCFSVMSTNLPYLRIRGRPA